MAQNNERNPHVVLIPVGAVAHGTTVKVVGPKLLRDAVILEVALVSAAAIAADATNKATAHLYDVENANKVVASGDTNVVGGLLAYQGLDLALISENPDPAGKELSGQGQVLVDKGHTLAADIVAGGTTDVVGAALSVTLYYL